jgi:hypothetical protein
MSYIKEMTPSEQCKYSGLNSLTEVSERTKVSVQTLINWHKNKPELFQVVIDGCFFNANTERMSHRDN